MKREKKRLDLRHLYLNVTQQILQFNLLLGNFSLDNCYLTKYDVVIVVG